MHPSAPLAPPGPPASHGQVCVRLHDESYDSDVFATAASSCRSCLVYAYPPALPPPTSTPHPPSALHLHVSPLCRYGMMECVLAAQEGGCGLIVYSRQEGNALGEVPSYSP